MKIKHLSPQFVEFIPQKPEAGVLYISMSYATTIHKCCCGCGLEVVAPLAPTDWKLTFDGVSVSLHPSIGNWSFPCQSHYWVRDNKVIWAARMAAPEIEAGRRADKLRKSIHYAHKDDAPDPANAASSGFSNRWRDNFRRRWS